MTHLTATTPRNPHRRAWQALTLGLSALLGLAGASHASAQRAAMNFGLIAAAFSIRRSFAKMSIIARPAAHEAGCAE